MSHHFQLSALWVNDSIQHLYGFLDGTTSAASSFYEPPSGDHQSTATSVGKPIAKGRKGGEKRMDLLGSSLGTMSCQDQDPPIWPLTMKIVQDRFPDPDSKVKPARTITWYDATVGGNLIRIDEGTNNGGGDSSETDSSKVLWDLELDSHVSYYYTDTTCTRVDFPVGILRPDWLEGASSLGEITRQEWNQGRPVCGWTKVDFIDYYVDKETGDPVSWYFHTMKAEFRVISYEANATIDPSLFEPPRHCFA